jgi:hypothetical protein
MKTTLALLPGAFLSVTSVAIDVDPASDPVIGTTRTYGRSADGMMAVVLKTVSSAC